MLSLTTLPLELLQAVDSFLDPYSKLSLRWTCGDLYHCLEVRSYPRVLAELYSGSHEVSRFKWLTDRERLGASSNLQPRLACARCFRRHPPSDFDPSMVREECPWRRECTRSCGTLDNYSQRLALLYQAEAERLFDGLVCSRCGHVHRRECFERKQWELSYGRQCLN